MSNEKRAVFPFDILPSSFDIRHFANPGRALHPVR